MAVAVTEHAAKRIHERVKLPTQKIADKAMEQGITHGETAGGLHRYFDYLFFQKRAATKIRILDYNVYLFTSKDLLITVFPLPHKFNTAFEKAKRKREEQNGEF